jgi:hypothetical protein
MRITINQLRRIIKEEVSRSLREATRTDDSGRLFSLGSSMKVSGLASLVSALGKLPPDMPVLVNDGEYADEISKVYPISVRRGVEDEGGEPNSVAIDASSGRGSMTCGDLVSELSSMNMDSVVCTGQDSPSDAPWSSPRAVYVYNVKAGTMSDDPDSEGDTCAVIVCG